MEIKINFLKEWRKRNKPRIREVSYGLKYFFKSPLAVSGLIILLVFIFSSIFSEYISPYPPNLINMNNRLSPPGKEHFLGTDELGRDIYSRIIYGSRTSLRIGVSVVLIAYSISIPLGTIAGYSEGLIDDIIMRLSDMFLAFPSIVLAMAFAASLGPGIYKTMLALSLTWWPWSTRVVRSQALSVSNSYYIQAAEAMGASDLRIILRHIIPNCMGVIIVQASVSFGVTMLASAALSFLGIGIQPPTPDWGLMVSYGRNYFIEAPWLSIFPGLAILIVSLGSNLIGDGLRDVFDPRLRRS